MENKDRKAVVIVTGAAAGLGKSIVDALGHYGIAAIGIDCNPGSDIVADVRSPIAIKGAVDDACLDIYGSEANVTGLINCAGVNSNQWFEDVAEEEFNRVMTTNAWSFVAMTQGVLDDLKESKGFVLNIVSNAAHIPMTSSLAYNASKAAALMITKQMAHELTPKYGITVFSISPNKLRGTEMSKQIEENVCAVRGWTPEFAAQYQKKALMHGLETEPGDLASFIAQIIFMRHWKYMSGTDIPFGK